MKKRVYREKHKKNIEKDVVKQEKKSTKKKSDK